MTKWRKIGLTIFLGAFMTGITLFILKTNAYAGFISGGPGNCGDFSEAVKKAEDGDVIAQMIGARGSDGAVITKNLRLSGGWFPGVNCDVNNQEFTTTMDFLDYGFTYNAPYTRSELNHFDSVLLLEDASDPNFPNLDKLIVEHLILASTGTPAEGGGIRGIISDGAEVLLDNVFFDHNYVEDYGGGLKLEIHAGSHLIIEDSLFAGNTAQDLSGGGLHVELWDDSRLTIRNSRFDDNNSINGGGFEIRVHDTSEVVIHDSEFTNNRTTTISGLGGAGFVNMDGGRLFIVDSTFSNNDAGSKGGGLHIEMSDGEVTVQNSVFAGNEADDAGGGLYVESVGDSPASVALINNSFSGNTPDPYQFIQSGSGSFDVSVLDQTTYLPAVLYNTSSAFQHARILSATLTADFDYAIEFETFNFIPDTTDVHVHFFFDTVAPDDAGVPGSGPWILYGGPSPFTGYAFADRPFGPDGAEKMCILVANPDHSIRPGTGNCVKLP